MATPEPRTALTTEERAELKAQAKQLQKSLQEWIGANQTLNDQQKSAVVSPAHLRFCDGLYMELAVIINS